MNSEGIFIIIEAHIVIYRFIAPSHQSLFSSCPPLPCRKEFKSMEQIEQHFNTKAHRKLVQDEFKRKREAERRKAKNAAAKQKKLEKAAKASANAPSGDVSVASLSLSSLPPNPPPRTGSTSVITTTSDGEDKGESDDDNNGEESSGDEHSNEESEDEDFLLMQMASNGKRSQQGLPDVAGDSDGD